ncbi:MAG: protein kinase [Deltaproteobacteria bacterium]|nr:protein kinase [Deltaproteobacteria bacterium]
MPIEARYELVRLLGRGGAAEVWEAKERSSGQLFALKRLLPGLELSVSDRSRLLEEARICRFLTHPGIVRLEGMGEEGGQPFLVFELVDGPTVTKLGRRLPPDLALYVAHRAAEALAYAHKATDERSRPLGIVHRDVSPENIILSRQGEVKILDFGIALALGRIAESTRVGYARGKVAYWSPEQAAGESVDARADVFSLGATLAFMVCGRSPFDDELGRTRHRQAASEVLRELPEDVRTIVVRATAEAPAERYPHSLAMARALSQACDARRFENGAESLARYLRSSAPPPSGKLGAMFALEGLIGESDPPAGEATHTLVEISEAPEELTSGQEVEKLELTGVTFGGEGTAGTDPSVPAEARPAISSDSGLRADADTVLETTHLTPFAEESTDRTAAETKSRRPDAVAEESRVVPALAECRTRYTVGASIGQSGELFAGTHTLLGRPCFIEIVKDPALAERRVESLRRIMGLKSSGVVEVIDLGRGRDGSAYVVTERIDGGSLAELLESSKPLSEARVLELAQHVARTLAACHEARIVHGGLRPSRILLRSGSTEAPALVRFGGLRGGADEFAAPEEVKDPDLLGPAADMYSFGMILRRLLAHRRSDSPPDPETLPNVALRPIVRALLNESPHRRPRAAEVARAIETLRVGRRRTQVLVSVTVALAAAAVALIWVAASRSPAELPEPSEDSTRPEAFVVKTPKTASTAVAPAEPPVPTRDPLMPTPRSESAIRPRVDRQESPARDSRVTKSTAGKLRETLRKRGLLAADLPSPLAEEVANAIETGSGDWVEIQRRVVAVPTDAALVKRKLARISQLLAAERSSLAPETYDELETRFLDLRASIRPGSTPASLEAACRRLLSLEQDLPKSR